MGDIVFRAAVILTIWAFALGLFNPFFENRKLKAVNLAVAIAASFCWLFA